MVLWIKENKMRQRGQVFFVSKLDRKMLSKKLAKNEKNLRQKRPVPIVSN